MKEVKKNDLCTTKDWCTKAKYADTECASVAEYVIFKKIGTKQNEWKNEDEKWCDNIGIETKHCVKHKND